MIDGDNEDRIQARPVKSCSITNIQQIISPSTRILIRKFKYEQEADNTEVQESDCAKKIESNTDGDNGDIKQIKDDLVKSCSVAKPQHLIFLSPRHVTNNMKHEEEAVNLEVQDQIASGRLSPISSVSRFISNNPSLSWVGTGSSSAL